jgi:hypothetical protein
MEGSVSGSALESAHNLVDAADAFVDEAQSFANSGVDLAQGSAAELVHTGIAAVEKVLAGLKALAGAV